MKQLTIAEQRKLNPAELCEYKARLSQLIKFDDNGDATNLEFFPRYNNDGTWESYKEVTINNNHVFLRVIEEPKFKVGDKVRLTHAYAANLPAMTEGEVEGTEKDGGYYVRINKLLIFTTSVEPVPKSTYAEKQAEWVKKNNIKVGDKVKLVSTWKDNEQGFNVCLNGAAEVLGKVSKIIEILPTHIRIDDEECIGRWFVPYFALELQKSTIIPFTFEDAAMFMGEFVIHRANVSEEYQKIYLICIASTTGICIEGQNVSYENMSIYYRFYNTKTHETKPFGKEVK